MQTGTQTENERENDAERDRQTDRGALRDRLSVTCRERKCEGTDSSYNQGYTETVRDTHTEIGTGRDAERRDIHRKTGGE